MDALVQLRALPGFVSSPVTFAALLSLATAFLWITLAPSGLRGAVDDRLDDYAEGEPEVDVSSDASFAERVLLPTLRVILRSFGKIGGKGNVEAVAAMLEAAGTPGGLTVVDFIGLRMLVALAMGGGLALVLVLVAPLSALVLLVAVPVGGIGAFLPLFWLRSQAKARSKAILKAIPDCLDMLTIGVEAGLAFESSLLRVAERWDNPLTYEFRRAVTEMRLGTPRDVALTNITERTDVPDLSTFVAILVQSNQMGLSITDVLHAQAEQMRTKRRQRAQEKAAQAGLKMLIPLVFLIFPNVMIVTLGPLVPVFMEMFS